MYPHTADCYWWDERDRLICTPACRAEHPRTWLVRREYESFEHSGITFCRGFWCVYQRQRWRPAGIYSAVAHADTFDEALALLRQPFTAIEMADHVSP